MRTFHSPLCTRKARYSLLDPVGTPPLQSNADRLQARRDLDIRPYRFVRPNSQRRASPLTQNYEEWPKATGRPSCPRCEGGPAIIGNAHCADPAGVNFYNDAVPLIDIRFTEDILPRRLCVGNPQPTITPGIHISFELEALTEIFTDDVQTKRVPIRDRTHDTRADCKRR